MRNEGPNNPPGLSDQGEDRGITVIKAEGGTSQVLPAGAWVLHADFVRQGPDLLLVGADGQEILIRDFFQLQNPPDLVMKAAFLRSIGSKARWPSCPR